jgi:hypothetical protein
LQALYGIFGCGIDGLGIIRVQLVSFSKPRYRSLDIRYLGYGVVGLALGKFGFRVAKLGKQVLPVLFISEGRRRPNSTLQGIQLRLASRLCISLWGGQNHQ